MGKRILIWIAIGLILSGCSAGEKSRKIGKFIPMDNRFWEVVPGESYIERIGVAFEFTEGPAWHPGGYLIFSDIPASRIYQWNGKKFQPYLDSSNQANGLLVEPGGDLLTCEQRTRCVARYTIEGERVVLADRYGGRRLNSPNDLCRSSGGVIYFTDPPWGLPEQNDDPAKELPFNGVFMWRKGELSLIDSTLTWPNGIALSPDEKYLYVANMETGGDLEKREAIWMRYQIDETGQPVDRSVFYRVEDPSLPGWPDGMKVDQSGNLFLTGPGGILVVDSGGVLLGTIELPQLPSNLTFAPGEKELFVTARSTIYRIVFE